MNAQSGDLRFVQVEPEHAAALVDIELTCFPTTDPGDLLSVPGVLKQCEVFPEGGIVVLDGERPVAFAMGCFVDFDIAVPQHDLDEVVGWHGSDNHDPHGEWYYGTDIAVLPEYRGRGIGRELYDMRKDLVRRFNRAGIVAGGVIPGYADHKHHMTADEYIDAVVSRRLADPTLSFQLANGFEARGAIAGYMRDDSVDDYAVLIVWHNPDYDPEALARQRAE